MHDFADFMGTFVYTFLARLDNDVPGRTALFTTFCKMKKYLKRAYGYSPDHFEVLLRLS